MDKIADNIITAGQTKDYDQLMKIITSTTTKKVC